MRKTMLRLLTYEPFEVVSEEEKAYIDSVLTNQANTSLVMYHDLFDGFYQYKQANAGINPYKTINSWSSPQWLAIWKNKYFPASVFKGRVDYPVLFKKICVYCIVEGNFPDKVFLSSIGMRENILNKWVVSPRYLKLIKRDTYSSIKMQRNGKKQQYLTDVIKAAYYESGRQLAAQHRLVGQLDWIAPKKNELKPFVDVFAGTGTVAASVDANEKVVNDIDVGVSCFLYAMSHDEKEVRERLAQLHNNFVTRDITGGQKLYTQLDWQKHQGNYTSWLSVAGFSDFMIRVRNNYQHLYNMLNNANNGVTPDFSDPSQIQMVYDIGVIWYFVNSIKPKSYRGNVFNVIDIDTNSYYDYLDKELGAINTKTKLYSQYNQNYKRGQLRDFRFIEKLKLKISNIKITQGKSFMKALKGAYVSCEDFGWMIKNYQDCFIYLDSPYFLTTDYAVPFHDEEHKQMLDLLRNARFDWLFSMQFKMADTDKATKGNRDRLQDQKKGQPLIRDYRNYYAGFANDFEVVTDQNGLKYYDANYINFPEYADRLYVIMFYCGDAKSDETEEMMICNFNPLRVIPYIGWANLTPAVIPYTKFMGSLFDKKRNCFRSVFDMLPIAKEWREQTIINSYASGDIV